jgi:hypothetical protein
MSELHEVLRVCPNCAKIVGKLQTCCVGVATLPIYDDVQEPMETTGGSNNEEAAGG